MPPRLSPRLLPAEDLASILAQLHADWEYLRGQSLFITGGTGFVGRWLVESLALANDRLALDARMVVLTRDPEGFARRCPHLTARKDVTLLQGDVRDFVYPPGHFSHIIHAATETSLPANDAATRQLHEIAVEGTRHTLEFAAQAGARKFLLVGSGAVYASSSDAGTAAIGEDDPSRSLPLMAGAAYAAAKRAAEDLACAFATNGSAPLLEIAIARCFAFVGPALPLDGPFAIGQFLADALHDRPIRLTSDGRAIRSYLYATDLAVWLWKILFRGAPLHAYNVGSARALSLREVAELIRQLSGLGHETVLGPASDAGRAGLRYLPNVSRARIELGCTETVSLEQALRKTLNWHGANFVKPAGQHEI